MAVVSGTDSIGRLQRRIWSSRTRRRWEFVTLQLDQIESTLMMDLNELILVRECEGCMVCSDWSGCGCEDMIDRRGELIKSVTQWLIYCN